MKKLFYLFGLILVIVSCSPKVTSTVSGQSDYKLVSVDTNYIDTNSAVNQSFYDDYISNEDPEENLNINITYHPSYSYFIDPFNYWYFRPYYSYYPYNGFGYGFSFGWGWPYYPYYGYGFYYPYWGYPYYYSYWGYPHCGYPPYHGYHGGEYYYGRRNVYPERTLGVNQSNNRTTINRNYDRNTRNMNNEGMYKRNPKYNRTQTYSSPIYKQPKTSREYYNSTKRYTEQNRSYSTPSNRSYSTPSNMQNNRNITTPSSRSYSTPSNMQNNRNITTPTQRNYSTPSNRSYSTPSNRSYSTPSPSRSPSYSPNGGMRSSPSDGGGMRSSPSGGGRR